MKNAHFEYWLRCGIPFRLLEATFGSYATPTQANRDAKLAMEEFCRRRRGFALIRGPWRSGRSHLAAAAVRHFGGGAFTSEAALYTEADCLPVEAEGPTFGKLLVTLKTCPLVVLDDLGYHRPSERAESLLTDVICFRAERLLPTIVVADGALSEKHAIPQGVRHVLGQMCTVIPQAPAFVAATKKATRRVRKPLFRFNGVLPADSMASHSSN